MPPAYELLLLNTSIPQIQAAQSGDTYLCPRELAVVVNSATDAVRITQTGAGNAILVEDSANPDSTPFVVTAAGDVGIGTNSPTAKLDVRGNVNSQADNAYYRIRRASAVDVGYITDSGTWGDSGTDFSIGASSSNLRFYTNNSGAERMRLNSSGNLGLGVTSLSPWVSVVKVLQIGAVGGTVIGGNTSAGGTSFFGQNYYYDTSYKFETANAATYYAQTAGQHQWWRSTATPVIGNDPVFSQAMTLDASGRLGIGQTNPTVPLEVAQSAVTYTQLRLANLSAGNNGGQVTFAGAANADVGWIKCNYPGEMLFGAYNTSVPGVVERARITSGGNLLVGGSLTAPLVASDFIASFTGGQGLSVRSTGGTGYYPLVCWNNATSGDNAFAAFGTEGTYTARGSIDYNRAGGQVRYNTTSDYRAKEVYGPVQDAGAQIDALKVYRGKMIGATQERPMMIAHEAQEVVPYAVGGEKDAVDENGAPKYQTMDHQILVPLLIAELQSLRARVKALEGA